MLLQSRGWEISLLVLVLAGVGLVSYWVYRDAAARGMDDAPYWGAAVGVASVVGIIVGGLVAVGVYLSTRPDAYAGGERPFDALEGGEPPAGVDDPTDPAHADLPPIPALTAERVDAASETTLRGYARRFDRLDATGDPEEIRAALAALVAADETDRLGETVEAAESDDSNDIGAAGTDHRRHAGRPQLRRESGTSAPSSREDGGNGSTADRERTDGSREFEWVEEA